MDAATPGPMARDRQLWWVGVASWLAVVLAGLIGLARKPELAPPGRAAGWIAAVAAFGVLHLFWAGGANRRRGARSRVTLLLLGSAAGLAANGLLPLPMPGVAIGGVLLVVVAGRAAVDLTGREAGALIATQTIALFVIYTTVWSWPPAVVAAAAYGAFQAIAYITGALAESESRARAELALSLAGLQAMQTMLAESAAMAERARIDRELHDVLGHHLTVLSLQLQHAGAIATGDAARAIAGAHALTRLILADVRGVVSASPDAAPAASGIIAALRRLAGGAPGVEVELDGPDELGPLDQRAAHVLFRCAQECITNVLRHSGAARARVRIERAAGSILLTIRDEGRGTPRPMSDPPRAGGGLDSMRERVRELGGDVAFESAPGKGFEVRVSIPGTRDDAP